MNHASRWLFVAVLAWPVFAAVAHSVLQLRRDRLRWTRALFATNAALTVAWVGVLVSSSLPRTTIEWNWSPGASTLAQWRFQSTFTGAIWSMIVALAAAISWSGTSGWSKQLRLPPAIVWGVIGSTVWLSAAGNPLTLTACWELSAISLLLLLQTSDEYVTQNRAAAQMLLTSLLFDGMLVTGAVIASIAAPLSTGMSWNASVSTIGPLLGLGMVLAAVGRAGLPPAAGWTRGLRDADPSLQISFWWLGIVPASGMLFQLAGQFLESRPDAAYPLWLVLGMMVLLSVVSGIARSRTGLIERIPTFVAGLIGLIALQGARTEIGISLFVFGFLLAVSVRVSTTPILVHPEGTLMRLAAQDWSTPELWRVFVELPFRGAAQLLRFLDGLIFDQLFGGMSRRLLSRAASAGVGRPDDPAWLPPVALLAATAVLIALSSR